MRDCGIESAPSIADVLPSWMMWTRRLRRVWGRCCGRGERRVRSAIRALESNLLYLLRARGAASLGEAFRFASAGGGGRLLTLNLYLDATIQLFEFCFELAWKLMKAVLSYERIEVSSPRASIREGWKQGLVQEAEAWLDMLEKRNLSAHTYNEQTAQVIYTAVKGTYFDMLATFDKDVAARLAAMQEVFR